MDFEEYKNAQGNSGVTAFQLGKEDIKVVFDNTVYLYSYAKAGKKHVEKMKKLAKAGEGLSTYISQNVKEKYDTKYPF